jgi:hypothetical protein
MDNTYWQKQTTEPLFPDLVWSRPENRLHAGKLLIVGGNLHGFSAPATAYQAAMKAGIGTARVLLPDALQKTVGIAFESGEYAPSTPSGSFSQQAFGAFRDHAAWADAILLAGDFGRNSETAILLEKMLTGYNGQLTLTKDAVDYYLGLAKQVSSRPDTLLVLTMAQLQKLGIALDFTQPITYDMDLTRLVVQLHEVTSEIPLKLLVRQHDHIITASDGQISTTILPGDNESWRVPVASSAAVWWLQHPQNAFEALTTSLWQEYNT